MKQVKISVVNGDAFLVKADALVLKYAQATHGLDRDVEREFNRLNVSIADKLPDVGGYYFTDSKDITRTKNIVFIGVPCLREFRYKEIREFGKRSLAALAVSDPSAETALMTVHGPGYGLDEVEAFKCQLAGIMDGISSGEIPEGLSDIIFVERSQGRVIRLQKVLKNLFPSFRISTLKPEEGEDLFHENSVEALMGVGEGSEKKKRIFVAMPFTPEFDDCFRYGIQGAVDHNVYLCERIDKEAFLGDILAAIKEKIKVADFVIADLSTANPNVYLEVGYAWGLGKKTILVVKDTKELKFDVQGQRCLSYVSIGELEAKLKKEIVALDALE